MRRGSLNPNTLEGVVLSAGGSAVSDAILGSAIQFIGGDGGDVPNAPLAGQAGLIVGASGGWAANIADFTVPGFVTPAKGHLAAWIASAPGGQIVGDYLWRTDIGVPEANRMHTSIDLGKHELDHVGQITGGPPATQDAGVTSASLAIHMANTLVAGTTPLADASLAAAPAEYLEDDGATTYPFYLRPDGSNRMKRLDPSTLIDAGSWDPQGGASPRSYPAGTRLVDALSPFVIMASYVASDNTVVPMPPCGNPASPDYTRARIFAMPLSAFDTIAPDAMTSSNLNFTPVPVVSNVTLTATMTLNIATTSINNPQSVSSTTIVDPQAIASSITATQNDPTSWLLHIRHSSGSYATSPTYPNGAANPHYPAPATPLAVQTPAAPYAADYPVRALVQTACYYGL